MATRWGIAGAGKISHDFVTALKTLPASEHVVVAVAARSEDRAKTFAKLHGIGTVYKEYAKLAEDDNVEVVYIGLLNPQHFEVATMMISQGKHVLCEKPLTMNLKQTNKLLNYAKSKNQFLMEAIWSRCFPVYDIIQKEIASGSLGEIYQVTVSFGFRMPDVERLALKTLGGGTILDLGVYGIQFACLVYNNELPVSVKATGILNDEGVDQSVTATFIYKGKKSATIMTSALVDLPQEAYILGTKGRIRVPNFWCPTMVELPSGTVHIPLPDVKQNFNFINSIGLSYEANEVRSCIKKASEKFILKRQVVIGIIESPRVSHSTSLLIARLEDEIRKQMDITYPEDL